MAKRRGSIRFVICLSFVILILTTFSIIGFFVISSWKVSVENIVIKIGNDVNQNILSQIDKFVNKPLYINAQNYNLLENEIVNLKDEKKRDQYFAGIVQANNQEVYSFSLGTETGEYYGARKNKKNETEIMENNVGTKNRTYYYSVTKDLTKGKL